MEKRFWVIKREEKYKVVFQSVISTGQISDRQLENLIIALNVKYELDDNEAIACFLKRNTKKHLNLLRIKRDYDGKRIVIYCENNLNITAGLFKEDELSRFQITTNKKA